MSSPLPLFLNLEVSLFWAIPAKPYCYSHLPVYFQDLVNRFPGLRVQTEFKDFIIFKNLTTNTSNICRDSDDWLLCKDKTGKSRYVPSNYVVVNEDIPQSHEYASR